MKKILILANDTTYTYNLRDEIIEKLISENYEVVVVSQLLNNQPELKDMGCRLLGLNAKRHSTNPLSDIKLYHEYKTILNSEKPDIVLTYNIKPNIYGGLACQKLKIPYLPNITGLGTPVEYPGPMQSITTRLYRMGVQGSDCVFFQNQDNLAFFDEHKMIAPDKNRVLLPGSGVNLKKHKFLTYPEDGGSIHFLFVARVMKEKGIDLYINAAREIYKENRKVMFHVCGYCDDKKYEEILKNAAKEGFLVYHGEQKNMIPFFEMAHCIVHPSYYPEGMSNVLLEAAAHGRPIITTDRAGCRETVEDNRTGYIIPIRQGKDLVEAIRKFLSLSWEQKQEMGMAGRRKMEKEFDRQIVAETYMEQIERILA